MICYDCETLTFQTHTNTHMVNTHTSLVPSGFGRGKYDEHSMITVVIFIVNSEPVSVPDPGIKQRSEHPIFAKNVLAMMSYSLI